MVELFETRALTQTVNQIAPVGNFFTKTFFPTSTEPTATHIDVEIIKGKRRMSPFVSPKIAGKVVTSLGKRFETYKPAYIKDKRIFDFEDATQTGTVFYGDNANPAVRLAKRIAEDLKDQREMIDRRIEWMASQAITTGQVSIIGDGIDDVVDFGMGGTHLVTLTGNALWTDTVNSDPRANLLTWRDVILQDSGLSPDICIMGRDAIRAYVNHPKVKDTLDTRRIDMGMIEPKHLPNGVIYYGYDKEIGCDIYTYNEWYFDEGTQTEKPFLPVDKIVFASTRAKTQVAHALIKDLNSLQATKIFTKSWEEQDPSARFLLTQSAPLVIPTQIDAFMCNKVV